MAEASRTPTGPGKYLDFYELRLLDPCQHQLSDAIASLNAEKGIAEIEQDHADFPPVVRIDRPGRVQHADPVFERQTAARPHLAFVSLGDGNGNARGNKSPAPCFNRDRTVHCRIQINTRCMLGLIVRDGKALGIPELGYLYDEMIGHNVIQESGAGARIQKPEEK